MLNRADMLQGLRRIDQLAREAGVVVDLSEAFYPSNRIPAKVRFGVEEIMERVQKRRSSLR